MVKRAVSLLVLVASLLLLSACTAIAWLSEAEYTSPEQSQANNAKVKQAFVDLYGEAPKKIESESGTNFREFLYVNLNYGNEFGRDDAMFDLGEGVSDLSHISEFTIDLEPSQAEMTERVLEITSEYDALIEELYWDIVHSEGVIQPNYNQIAAGHYFEVTGLDGKIYQKVGSGGYRLNVNLDISQVADAPEKLAYIVSQLRQLHELAIRDEASSYHLNSTSDRKQVMTIIQALIDEGYLTDMRVLFYLKDEEFDLDFRSNDLSTYLADEWTLSGVTYEWTWTGKTHEFFGNKALKK